MNLKCIFVFLFAKERKIYTVFIDRPGFLKIKVISFPFRFSLLTAFFVNVELCCVHEIPKGPIIPEVPRQKHSFAFMKEPIGSYRLCFVRSFARRLFNEEIQKTITVHNMLETVVFIPNRSTPFQWPLRYLIHLNKRVKLSCKMGHSLQREDV